MRSYTPVRGWLARRRATMATVSVLVGLLASSLAGGARAQDGSPVPSADPTPTATALPEGLNRKMAGKIDSVIDSVRPVRRLPAAEGVAYRQVERETFRSEMEELFRKEYSDAYLAAEDDAFTRLGLIGPDDDLEELVLSLYDSQAVAYYDPRTTTFSLVGDARKIGALESIVVAHEYGHALQDAAWDLEAAAITELDQADAILAQQALAEGDATAVMYDWARRELKLADLLRASAQALVKRDEKTLRRMPPILRRQLEFPYIDGFAFVNALRFRGDAPAPAGNWTEVNAAWETPPVSTEQILHPELYPDELPVEVPMPDVAALLGLDWNTAYEQTLGEMQIGVWVADGKKAREAFPVLPAQLPRAEAAAGWGGDRLLSLDGPGGAWAIVWQTDWDSRDDAGEFRKAARAAMRDLPGAHSATGADVSGGLSSPVLVLVADSEDTLGVVRTALDIDS